MKTYIAILIGIVVLAGGVFGGMNYMRTHKKAPVKNVSSVMYATIEGDVVRWFEGTSTLAYSFDIPQTATTSTDMNGALIRVKDANTLLASVYVSYEGGRGHTPLDYITDIVAPHVAVITPTGTSTYGAYDWTTAETAGSNWYIASVANGSWLVVVEGKKSLDLDIKHILETMKLEGKRWESGKEIIQ
jgi:hypothetical protein